MEFEVIIVGGGLAGSTLAKTLAENGISTLVLEHETKFKDRVRGEQMHCWGAVEARRLGIYDRLMETCGHEIQYVAIQLQNAPPRPVRDMIETTPHHVPILNFYHPAMQEVLLHEAQNAGASVQRGATVTAIRSGARPEVRVRGDDGKERTYQAQLVVGADGRASKCRRWGNFEVQRDPHCMTITGVLLEDVHAPDDALSMFLAPANGQMSLIVPVGDRRFRTYLATHTRSPAERQRFSGEDDLAAFLNANIAVGVPANWFDDANSDGPLASFSGAETWVEHPYRDRIVLIGDAASTSDPSYGCGLSLTLRDVRVLRDRLLSEHDREAAANKYAAEHDQYYGTIRRLTGWVRTLMHDPSHDAARLRKQAFPRFAEDPSRIVDLFGIGPEFPSDEAARQRYFGEI